MNKGLFFNFFPKFFAVFEDFSRFCCASGALHFEKSSNMAKNWSISPTELSKLESRVSGTRSVTSFTKTDIKIKCSVRILHGGRKAEETLRDTFIKKKKILYFWSYSFLYLLYLKIAHAICLILLYYIYKIFSCSEWNNNIR